MVTLQSGADVCFRHVAQAERLFERVKGLLGKKEFPVGHVMWFRPCASIHTFFMRFCIDVVFLSQDLVVTDVRMGVKPWRVVIGARGSHSVLEAQTGWMDPALITIGMPFVLADY